MAAYGTGRYGVLAGTYGDLGAEATPTIGLAGVAPVFVSATAGGDCMRPARAAFLVVRNAGGSPVVVSPEPTCSDAAGNPSLPTTVSVPAGGERWIGPFPPEAYATTDGAMDVGYSGVAGVTVCVLQAGG